MIFVYRIILGIPGILALSLGANMVIDAELVTHQTVGLLGILIGAVFITGYMIVESIMSLRKELKRATQELKRATQGNNEEGENEVDQIVL